MKITKTTTETFEITAENAEAKNYAKEMILRGDYAFRLSLCKKITGDGYVIQIKKDKPVFDIINP